LEEGNRLYFDELYAVHMVRLFLHSFVYVLYVMFVYVVLRNNITLNQPL
jgi:hypothetical protein